MAATVAAAFIGVVTDITEIVARVEVDSVAVRAIAFKLVLFDAQIVEIIIMAASGFDTFCRTRTASARRLAFVAPAAFIASPTSAASTTAASRTAAFTIFTFLGRNRLVADVEAGFHFSRIALRFRWRRSMKLVFCGRPGCLALRDAFGNALRNFDVLGFADLLGQLRGLLGGRAEDFVPQTYAGAKFWRRLGGGRR